MRKSKQDRVKAYLKQGYALTPLAALKRFGCFRLAAIVFRLKREHGMNIENVGEHRFAIYQIKKQ